MSKFKPFKCNSLNVHPLSERKSKVTVSDFAKRPEGVRLGSFIDSIPNILAGRDLRLLRQAILEARRRGRGIVWGFGGHVVKVGLAPLIIELMRRSLITGLATNGSGLIHDFEIALAGHTSEDVDQALPEGTFGMARETGETVNRIIAEGVDRGVGIGEAICDYLVGHEMPYAQYSIFAQAGAMGLPVTVHIAIGTDTIHFHPEAKGEALGQGSLTDFYVFAEQVRALHQGGVYVNLGSAVVLPEVFIKAVSLVRNQGVPLRDFTTANLDFIQHYRPLQNVVRRPVLEAGVGIALTGHHEILVPLLVGMLLEGE